MTRAIATTYNLATEYRLQITYAFLAVCAALIMAYGVNVYALISHTIALEKIEAQVLASNNSLKNLDSTYISLSSNITPDTLGKYGFAPAKVSEFISRSNVVAYRGHEF